VVTDVKKIALNLDLPASKMALSKDIPSLKLELNLPMSTKPSFTIIPINAMIPNIESTFIGKS
jgi:hypothetical protein